MTLRSLINFGDALNKVGSVNIRIGDNDDLDISYCVLKQEREIVNIVKIEHRITHVSDVCDQLAQHLPEGSQIHINFDGKGLLRKTIGYQEASEDIAVLISKFFPLVKPDEFIGQLSVGADKKFLTIIRRDILEHIRALEQRYSIVGISLGLFVVGHMAGILKTPQIGIGTSLIHFTEGKIADIVPTTLPEENKVVIGNDKLGGSQLQAYSSALSLFMRHRDSFISPLEIVSKANTTFSFNRNLYRGSKFALLGVLAVLFVNTIGYLTLQSKVEAFKSSLEYSTSQSEAQKKSHEQTNALVTSYEKLGWRSNVQPLFYCDQLALKVTDAIVLTNLEVGVLDNELLKKEKRTLFQSNLIKVQGMAADPVALQQWIEEVEKLFWVDHVYDEKYQHDRRSGKGVFEFYITAR